MKAHSTGHTFNDILFWFRCMHVPPCPLCHYMWLYLQTYAPYSHSITRGLPYIQPTEARGCKVSVSDTSAPALHMTGISAWSTCHVSTLYKKLYLLKPLWKLRLPLDGSKCHLFHLFTIHTPEAIPHGMVQPITAAMLERFQNLNKTSQPNHSYQSM